MNYYYHIGKTKYSMDNYDSIKNEPYKNYEIFIIDNKQYQATPDTFSNNRHLNNIDTIEETKEYTKQEFIEQLNSGNIKRKNSFNIDDKSYKIGQYITTESYGKGEITNICINTYRKKTYYIWVMFKENPKYIAQTFTFEQLKQEIIEEDDDDVYEENIVSDEHEDYIDFRKKYEPEYRANDWHYVRSQGEMLIDNWLYENNIAHEYEKILRIDNEEFFVDFYIKSMDLYIEYFGMPNDDNYKEKMERKIYAYQRANLNTLYIYPNDMKNLADILQKKIL